MPEEKRVEIKNKSQRGEQVWGDFKRKNEGSRRWFALGALFRHSSISANTAIYNPSSGGAGQESGRGASSMNPETR